MHQYTVPLLMSLSLIWATEYYHSRSRTMSFDDQFSPFDLAQLGHRSYSPRLSSSRPEPSQSILKTPGTNLPSRNLIFIKQPCRHIGLFGLSYIMISLCSSVSSRHVLIWIIDLMRITGLKFSASAHYKTGFLHLHFL